MICVDDWTFVLADSHTSKGNQLKWKLNDRWCKADYLGYEGMAEYAASKILKKSNVSSFVDYELEKISYKGEEMVGCVSRNFLDANERLVTVERLYHQFTGKSMLANIVGMDTDEKISCVVKQVEDVTGLKHFGEYLTLLLEIDAIFLNEDRHGHNIAVVCDEEGNFRLSPVFDEGAGLFSDLRLDYPLEADLRECYKKIEARPFHIDFDEQVDAAESMYGVQLKITADEKYIEDLLQPMEEFYTVAIIQRVREILYDQKRKYQYIWK